MGIKVYGNYCGPGWTGGEYVTVGQKGTFNVAPIDELDALCRAHDIAYGQAIDLRNTGDVAGYWSTILGADNKLLTENAALLKSLYARASDTTKIDLALHNEITYAQYIQAAFILKARYWNAPNSANAPPLPADQRMVDEFLWNLLPIANRSWDNPTIPMECNRNWISATTPPRRDPLAIDLDGDGIETVGIPTNGAVPVLFDHDGDTVKTGTGWLKPDDAWLALDRDGNGSIDSGQELFGVDTFITVTEISPGSVQSYTHARNARTGFEALRSLDTGSGNVGSAGYGDGVFDAKDAAFTQVKLWQDFNQDGVSQANELSNLAGKGITSIGLNASTTTTNLGNGNSITGQAIVTRSNGSNTVVDSVDLQAGNLELANNPFYRQFGDSVALTAAARALPEIGGSGWLRDLREAMSLGTAQAQALQQQVTRFAAMTTRDQQVAAISDLIDSWARTTGRVDTTGARRPLLATVIADDGMRRTVRYTPMDPANYPTTEPIFSAAVGLPIEYYVPSSLLFNAAGQEVIRRLGELEAFNGSRFINFTETGNLGTVGAGAGGGGGGNGGGGGVAQPTRTWTIAIDAQQVAAINAAYDVLTESVYSALAVQTRLRPYLDSISLVIDDSGIHFDSTALQNLLASTHATTPQKALEDLVELEKFAAPTLGAVGYDGLPLLRTWVEALPAGSPLFTTLAGMGVVYGASTAGTPGIDLFLGDASADTADGGGGADMLDGGAGADTLRGGDGDDRLYGRADNDALLGQAGDDVLDGGEGNDALYGGLGNNTYLFGRGDGQDVVHINYDATPGKLNTLRLKAGVAPSDVLLKQVYDTDLGFNVAPEVSIAGTADRITFGGFAYLRDPSNAVNSLQQIAFADGTTWDLGAIKAQLFAGTPAADTITGTIADDTINGGAGADSLYGNNGNDTLKGGDGNDALSGENGNDTLDGGAGNDALYGGLGNNTYLFGKGDGQDVVHVTYDATPGKLNTLQLSAGVAASDVLLKQVYDTDLGSNVALEVSIAGTTDRITLDGFTYGGDPTNLANSLQQIRFADGTVWDLNAIKAQLFAGTPAADTITGTIADDTISGGAGADCLYGNNGNDTLKGGDGNDALSGENGDDTLDGGAGNDALYGGLGNNTYLFGRSDGQDVVHMTYDATPGKLNALQLKAGVTASDLLLKQVYDTDLGFNVALEVSIAGTADKITLGGFFYGGDPTNATNSVQQIRFADGTVWNLAAIQAKLSAGSTSGATINGTPAAETITGSSAADTINGAAGADILYGRSGNDTLNGGADNDTLYGENGADTLDGGTGNDTLYGGTGNNTYLFGRGDGQDLVRATYDATAGKLNTLQLKAGVAASDVVLKQVYDDDMGGNVALGLSIAGTTDKITLDGFLYGDNTANGYNSLQQIKFADGTSWDLAAIRSRLYAGTAASETLTGTTLDDVINGAAGADILYGRSGNDTLNGGADNDTLYGENGADTLDGGTGNDTLYGGTGNNTYLFGRGDGQDLVRATYDATAGKLNTLQLKAGVAASDVVLKQVYDDDMGGNVALGLSIAGTTDKITLDGFLYGDNTANGYNSLQQIKFADGTSWDLAAIRSRLYAGTAASATPTGTTVNDTLDGGVDNDTLSGESGASGDDFYDPGAGDATSATDAPPSSDSWRWSFEIATDTLIDAGSTSIRGGPFAAVTTTRLKLGGNSSELEAGALDQSDKRVISSGSATNATSSQVSGLTEDSKVLAFELQGLLGAMAVFSPPGAAFGAGTAWVDPVWGHQTMLSASAI